MSNSTYFAYGSNLNASDLRRWCGDNAQPYPLLSFLAKAWLPDYQLLFNYYSSVRKGGALNIRPRTGYAVPGILFKVTEFGREILHLKERAPDFYQELEVIVLDENGQEHKGFTFTAAPHRHTRKHIPPDAHYRQTVQQGVLQHDLTPSIFHSACQGNEEEDFLPLFVYGTLMQGEDNHPLLQAWISGNPRKGTVQGELYNLGNFPGMVPCSGKSETKVHGELYFPEPNISTLLKELDRIEGFTGHGNPGSLYSRTIQEVKTDSETFVAWVYFLRKRVAAPLIDSGDWRKR